MSARLGSSAVFGLWIALCTGGAHAQTGDLESGRSHFDRGVGYVQDGDLKAALIEFKRAYSAAPNYRVLYNLGQVSSELREYTDARRYFERYLKDGAGELDPARKREVEAALGKLSSRIATLVLSADVQGAELFVDDVSVGRTPLGEPVRVDTGVHRISAAVSGRSSVTRQIEAAGGETLVVRLEFPANAQEPLSHEPPRTSERHAQAGGPGPALWLGLGTGALAIGSGVMAYLAAHDAAKYHDAIERKTTARELGTLDDGATTKALVTDILLGTTAVAATLTLIFALQGGERRETSSRREAGQARLRLGPGSLQLTGHFE
jgi:tetratricopeptide (TPR) repeat protein